MTQTLSDATAEGRDEAESIALSEIREGAMTIRMLSSGRKAILFKKGNEIRAFSEVCPHMGADMADGIFCAKDGTLACKWHGYLFSTDDGSFLHNPNEKLMPILRKPSEHFQPDKTPAYRLRPVPFTIKGDRLVFGRDPNPMDDR